jgi:hypothetical protein
MAKNCRTERGTLEYPHHAFKPLEIANFIQMHGFTEEWEGLGLTDDNLRDLETAIMASPTGSPVVRGTGGLRKLRFSPAGWPRGKSGALRVGYVYFRAYCIVVLIVVYTKTETDNISPAGRKVIYNVIKRLEREFARAPLK